MKSKLNIDYILPCTKDLEVNLLKPSKPKGLGIYYEYLLELWILNGDIILGVRLHSHILTTVDLSHT